MEDIHSIYIKTKLQEESEGVYFNLICLILKNKHYFNGGNEMKKETMDITEMNKIKEKLEEQGVYIIASIEGKGHHIGRLKKLSLDANGDLIIEVDIDAASCTRVNYAEEMKMLISSLCEDVKDSSSITEMSKKVDNFYRDAKAIRDKQKCIGSEFDISRSDREFYESQDKEQLITYLLNSKRENELLHKKIKILTGCECYGECDSMNGSCVDCHCDNLNLQMQCSQFQDTFTRMLKAENKSE